MIFKIEKFYSNIFNNAIVFLGIILTRGGGGGSGGGGGGGGGGGFGGGGSGGNFDPRVLPWALGAGVILLVFAYFYNKKVRLTQIKTEEQIIKNENLDWNQFRQRVEEIFYKFEEAWGKFDMETLKAVLTDDYFKRITLELGVLQNEKRMNQMFDLKLFDVLLVGEETDISQSRNLVVRISAQAVDTLTDVETNMALFVDSNPFTEYWHFVKDGDIWKLNLITQKTEDPALVESEIAVFAKKHSFYFDPDFGWLMLPNKGALFSQSSFGISDVNNHVIGYFREKIIEFYTYIPNPNSHSNCLIVQAILPVRYTNIFIRKKKLFNFSPHGLQRIYLEWPDFNKKFCLWADPKDQINSLELLTPNFMDRIYNLPFEVNIEIVGSFLYFYTKDRGQANYENMLEILSYAFDEMKM